MKDDRHFLLIAIDEAKKSKSPHKFGAVIVKDGEIVAQDCNHVREINDPSAHAEISAIRKASKILDNYNIDGSVLYASHEPCLMCFSCAAWANVSRIVYAHPASDSSEDSYEFKGVSLPELAQKLVRPIKVELIRV